MPTMRVGTPSIGMTRPSTDLVAAERASPELAREGADVFRAGQRVVARELPAAERRDAEHRHQLGRDDAPN